MYHVFKRIIGVDLLLDITASNQTKGYVAFFPSLVYYLAQYELCLYAKFYCSCFISSFRLWMALYNAHIYEYRQKKSYIVSNTLLV